MIPNELRIGNWYISTKFQTPVICEMGDFYEIYARADGSSEYNVDDIFQPIPLTEEWLLKFGFERLINNAYADYILPDWGICFDVDTNTYFWYDWDKLEIKYVHQLQNLHFALKGKEIEIKNNL